MFLIFADCLPNSGILPGALPGNSGSNCPCAAWECIARRCRIRRESIHVGIKHTRITSLTFPTAEVERSVKSLAARSRCCYSTAGRTSVSRRASILFGLYQLKIRLRWPVPDEQGVTFIYAKLAARSRSLVYFAQLVMALMITAVCRDGT